MANKAKRFEVFGVEEVVGRLKSIYALFDDPVAIQDVFYEAGLMLRDEAIQRVPVHSGLLRSMIRVERRGKKFPIAVLVVKQRDVRYVSFVELGSKHAVAQPFLRPTFDAKGPKAVEYIGMRLRAMIESKAA